VQRVHLARGVRLVGSVAAAVALVVVGPVSASTAQSAGPSGSPAIVEPFKTVEAGSCDPSFIRGSKAWAGQGLCSTVEVAQWLGIPYTPPVDCGGNQCQLPMDIAAPTSGGPWPIVVVLPGGPGSPTALYPSLLDSFAAALAGQGAVVMVSGWREGDAYGGGYPTSFADIACAIGVARRIGPAYGADPDRVALVGFSTGGWPAMVLGLTPTPYTPAPGSCNATSGSLRPDAAVSVNGVIDEVTGQEDGNGYVVGFMGGDQETHADAWAASDPFALVERFPAGPDAIPFLLVHGADDTWAPNVAESFQAALTAAGYDSRLLTIPDTGHQEAMERKGSVDAIVAIARGS
jgi:acetyl esterase/lipase